MNKFLNNLERKIGKYAIPNLTMYIIGLYIIGYMISIVGNGTGFLSYLTLDPNLVLHGEIWRLFTWVIIPMGRFNLLTIITLLFYYFVGNTMERTLGTFRYNVFIFAGCLFMILAAFLTYFFYGLQLGFGSEAFAYELNLASLLFSTTHIQTIVFLAFAICYPNLQVLLMFIIPVKVKYLGILYGVGMVIEVLFALFSLDYATLFAVLLQLINLLLFYISLGKAHHLKPSEVKRRNDFKKNTKIVPPGITRHKCAVCGKTEISDPNAEFRFCSKCNGNYEYCQDHLFTHQHIK